MNLLRICVQHIDAMVAGTMSSAAIVQWMMSQSPPHERNLTKEQLSSKMAGKLRADWNIKERKPVIMAHIALANVAGS